MTTLFGIQDLTVTAKDLTKQGNHLGHPRHLLAKRYPLPLIGRHRFLGFFPLLLTQTRDTITQVTH